MIGLIIKDMMCLKGQLKTFAYVVCGVLAVSVMYVISCRTGNLAALGDAILATDGDVQEFEVRNIASMALIVFLLLPVASIGDLAGVFSEDHKASFGKVAGSLPLSLNKRLLSRYLSIFSLIALGVAVDVLIASVLSALTDLMTFAEFLGVIIAAASVMAIYCALVIFYCVMLGSGREQFSMLISLLTMVVLYVVVRFRKLREIFVSAAEGSAGDNDMDVERLWDFLYALKSRSWKLLVFALLVIVISYVASYAVADRKRGVI